MLPHDPSIRVHTHYLLSIRFPIVMIDTLATMLSHRREQSQSQSSMFLINYCPLPVVDFATDSIVHTHRIDCIANDGGQRQEL